MIQLLIAVALQQGEPCEPITPCCNKGRDAKPWKGYDLIPWERSLDAAKARAAREAKPILLFQLVGDLDKEGC